MNKYHIAWMQQKEDGEIICTGKTYEAESMFEALVEFGEEHPEVDEPLYAMKTTGIRLQLQEFKKKSLKKVVNSDNSCTFGQY